MAQRGSFPPCPLNPAAPYHSSVRSARPLTSEVAGERERLLAGSNERLNGERLEGPKVVVFLQKKKKPYVMATVGVSTPTDNVPQVCSMLVGGRVTYSPGGGGLSQNCVSLL